MEPWQSWTAAIILGAVATWYYSKDSKSGKGKVNRPGVLGDTYVSENRKKQDKDPSKRKEKAKSSTAEEDTSNGRSLQPKKRSRNLHEPDGSHSKNSVIYQNELQPLDQHEGDLNNTQIAQQLEARKHGVSLGSLATPEDTAKSSNRQPVDFMSLGAKPGSDFDDAAADHVIRARVRNRNIASPKIGAVNLVSDMLDAPIPSASILRITGAVEPKKVEEAQPSQSKEKKETKKQRQNRRRNEEKRAFKEEQEQERRILLEKQRRQAREARGEYARNGLGPKTVNGVWSSRTELEAKPHTMVQSNSLSNTRPNELGLLDTFEPGEISTVSSNDRQINTNLLTTATSRNDQDLPSEEVQLEMLSELNKDIGWNEVPKKTKKGKKRGQDLDISNFQPDTKSTIDGALSPERQIEPPPLKSSKINQHTNEFSVLMDAFADTSTKKGHPEDSDWAVL